MKIKFAICLFFWVFGFALKAQTDTISPKEEKDINYKFLDTSLEEDKYKSPKKAAIYSTLLPGLGQAYNEKYWKIPVIYGLSGLFVYKIIDNNKYYKTYRNELFQRDISSAYPEVQWSNTNSDLAALSYQTIKTRKDIFRKKRDRMILYSGLFYALNIVDAVVDAHLSTFNTNKKNMLSIRPALVPVNQTAGMGLNLKWSF